MHHRESLEGCQVTNKNDMYLIVVSSRTTLALLDQTSPRPPPHTVSRFGVEHKDLNGYEKWKTFPILPVSSMALGFINYCFHVNSSLVSMSLLRSEWNVPRLTQVQLVPGSSVLIVPTWHRSPPNEVHWFFQFITRSLRPNRMLELLVLRHFQMIRGCGKVILCQDIP